MTKKQQSTDVKLNEPETEHARAMAILRQKRMFDRLRIRFIDQLIPWFVTR